MNQAFVTVIAAEAPIQEYIDASRTIVKCQLTIPATGKRNVDTPVEYRIWKDQDKFLKMVQKGQHLYIAGAKLRHDLDTRTYSLQDGNWIIVPNGQFPLLNQIILSGRCIKDIDHADPRQFRSTESGYIITNQTSLGDAFPRGKAICLTSLLLTRQTIAQTTPHGWQT